MGEINTNIPNMRVKPFYDRLNKVENCNKKEEEKQGFIIMKYIFLTYKTRIGDKITHNIDMVKFIKTSLVNKVNK